MFFYSFTSKCGSLWALKFRFGCDTSFKSVIIYRFPLHHPFIFLTLYILTNPSHLIWKFSHSLPIIDCTVQSIQRCASGLCISCIVVAASLGLVGLGSEPFGQVYGQCNTLYQLHVTSGICSFLVLCLYLVVPWELQNYEILIVSFCLHLLARIILYGSASCHLFGYPIVQLVLERQDIDLMFFFIHPVFK